MARSLPYSIGDVFEVPLRDGGRALGVVARMNGKGVVLGYFFGPRIGGLHELGGQQFQLKSVHAIKVCRFGDLGLIRKEWLAIGKVAPWEPTEWPVPVFCRKGEFAVSYDPVSLDVVNEERCDSEECSKLPRDGLEGAGYVEIKLTRILAEEASGY